MERSFRKAAREQATIGIYQNILVGSQYEEIEEFLRQDEKLTSNEKSMLFALSLVQNVLNSKDSYIALLTKYLKKGWTFERLSAMEQAILLVAASEILETDLANEIVINEAVVNAKKFCDEDSYKFINGILKNIV